MPRTLLVLALLCVPLSWRAVHAGPPGAPSGKMVRDEVSCLQVEVQRLEKEVASNRFHPGASDELDEARARLAAAEGRIGAARMAWKEIIRRREAKARMHNHVFPDPAKLRLADAQCALAEVERDRAAQAAALSDMIDFHKVELAQTDAVLNYAEPPRQKALPEEFEKLERPIRKKIRQLRERLDAVKRR